MCVYSISNPCVSQLSVKMTSNTSCWPCTSQGEGLWEGEGVWQGEVRRGNPWTWCICIAPESLLGNRACSHASRRAGLVTWRGAGLVVDSCTAARSCMDLDGTPHEVQGCSDPIGYQTHRPHNEEGDVWQGVWPGGSRPVRVAGDVSPGGSPDGEVDVRRGRRASGRGSPWQEVVGESGGGHVRGWPLPSLPLLGA